MIEVLRSYVSCVCGAFYKILSQPYTVRWQCKRCGRKTHAWSMKHKGKGREHETCRPRVYPLIKG